MKKRVVKTCIIIIGAILLGIFGLGLYFKITVSKSFMIEKGDNYFDYQDGLQCAGYATAYVLRSMGKDAKGLEVYNKITNKNADGTVPIEVLTQSLKDQNIKAKLKNGLILQLKQAVSKGIPVIVFVKSDVNSKWYHYLPIVGYDSKYIYAADSLQFEVNADETDYNRKISISDFEKMWKTELGRNNQYIVFE
mgnify:CR=1 FL=1